MMKKLNKKGFTLVELLATVVILSLVTGVAVPVTTNIVANSKYRSLSSIVDEAENFLSDQWRVHKISPDTINDAFDDAMGGSYYEDVKKSLFTSIDAHKRKYPGDNPTQEIIDREIKLLQEMGMSTEDVAHVDMFVDDKGIGCVIIRTIPITSKLYNSKYWTDTGDGFAVPSSLNGNERYFSKCCTLDQRNDN